MSVYLDYAATTPVDPQFVKDASEYMLRSYYNPSASYAEAGAVKRDMEEARAIIAESINAEAEEIIFTSGATEANNMVINGFMVNDEVPDYIVTSPYEHPSVANAAKNAGLSIFINTVEDIFEWYPYYNRQPGLFTYMMANNEVGFIQDIKKVAEIAHAYDSVIHTDATQAYGHIPIDVKNLDVDYMTVSFHKCGCAKGIGFLYVKDGCEVISLMYGGGQEGGKRPGTENTAFIYASGQHIKRMEVIKPDHTLRDHLKSKIKLLPYCHINETENQLPGILSITIDGVRSDVLLALLNENGICCSAGSACHAGDPRPSSTLLAFGLTEDEALRTIRVSWGEKTKKEDLDFFVYILQQCMRLIE